MPFTPFHDFFPEISDRETRTITVAPESDDDPLAGKYEFYEFYCDETGCDCRRVYFYVVSPESKETVAVIGWGWEKPDFYAKWFKHGHPDAHDVAEMIGPSLNEWSDQSELAPAILDLVRDVLLKDPEYVERIKRHYRMFRDRIDKRSGGERQLLEKARRSVVPPRAPVMVATSRPRLEEGKEMRVEEQYEDVLQNIEFAIVSTYRESPDMTDHAAMRALEALIDSYVAEKIGRAPRNFLLSELERTLMGRVRVMCEWRLGRDEGPGPFDEEDAPASEPDPEPMTVDEILLCLKRIVKSVKKWNREGGTRGYLDFVAQYVA